MTLADLPDLCTIDQVCAWMQISQAKFFELRQTGCFPIPEVFPRLGRGVRFSKANLARYERGEFAMPRRVMSRHRRGA